MILIDGMSFLSFQSLACNSCLFFLAIVSLSLAARFFFWPSGETLSLTIVAYRWTLGPIIIIATINSEFYHPYHSCPFFAFPVSCFGLWRLWVVEEPEGPAIIHIHHLDFGSLLIPFLPAAWSCLGRELSSISLPLFFHFIISFGFELVGPFRT